MEISIHKPIDEKFKETILYILSKCAENKTFGKTVLFKLLYFSDFNFYQLNYRTITGQKYRKIENVPAPVDFDIAIKQLENEGKIKVDLESRGSYEQFVFTLMKEPNIKFLSKDESDIINKVCSKLGHLKAKEISNISHHDMPWKATKLMDLIDYDLVFYREGKISNLFE